MAILWEKRLANNHYQVRTAGKTKRLYTNGVFHSQHHPERALTHGVWDLLWLPSFFYPKGSVKNILMLGTGGGAAIHHIMQHIQPHRITAIDIDPYHLRVAQKYFQVQYPEVELIEADAIQWVQNNKTQYDIIIDDLYGEEAGEPVRPIGINNKWIQTLESKLTPKGQIVFNFAWPVTQTSLATKLHSLPQSITSGFLLTTPLYSNTILCLMKQNAQAYTLRRNLKKIPQLNPDRKNGARYSIKSLKLT